MWLDLKYMNMLLTACKTSEWVKEEPSTDSYFELAEQTMCLFRQAAEITSLQTE
jgi:hypothetical protein